MPLPPAASSEHDRRAGDSRAENTGPENPGNESALEEEARRARAAAGERLASQLGGIVRLVAAALLISLVIRSFLVQPFAIPSSSMSPLLKAGDFVFVDKAAYGWTLASLPLSGALGADEGDGNQRLFGKPVNPGDVIVFVSPDGQDYVKRMVASGGDRVEMRKGQLVLNGRAIPCLPEGAGLCRETLPNGASHSVRSNGSGPLSDMTELMVPEGHYFVLGDNRDDSADSRLSRSGGGVGMVPDANVIGRASRIFFSSNEGVRWARIGQAPDRASID